MFSADEMSSSAYFLYINVLEAIYVDGKSNVCVYV